LHFDHNLNPITQLQKIAKIFKNFQNCNILYFCIDNLRIKTLIQIKNNHVKNKVSIR
jgi:hypothetical protein